MKKFKEVFILVQQKGYNPYITSNAYGLLKLKDYWYLELCMIQAWLRDKHEVYVLIEWQHAEMFWAVVKSNSFRLETENCEAASTYEYALLNGIEAAINLL